jgi:hypothetical protein
VVPKLSHYELKVLAIIGDGLGEHLTEARVPNVVEVNYYSFYKTYKIFNYITLKPACGIMKSDIIIFISRLKMNLFHVHSVNQINHQASHSLIVCT